MSKVRAAAERIRDIDPTIGITEMETFYGPDTAQLFDFTKIDYVVDAIDTVTGKLMLVQAAKEAGTPVISCMGAGNKLDPTAFEVTDISKTSVCPLARVVRRELKARGIAHHKVLFSTEEPITPAPLCAEEGRRAIPGSTVFVPPVAGILLAREAVLELIGR
jgi:tRNA A37 threonylcarbamoyladenosine dehydratase